MTAQARHRNATTDPLRTFLHATVSILLFVAGCMVGEDVSAGGQDLDDAVPTVVVEGTELAKELSHSPAHEAETVFRRLSLTWEGGDPDSVQIAISPDGASWSRWFTPALRNVEVEQHTGFVAELNLSDEGPARFYRLRAGRGQRPDFLKLQFLSTTASEALEEGQITVGGESEVRQALSSSLNIEVLPRSAWGAKDARCGSKKHTPSMITLHHTVGSNRDDLSPAAQIRQIQIDHQKSRKWCDIGYHFLISRDGRIWQGRPVDEVGSHTEKNNTKNVGIVLMGNYETSEPTSAQKESAAHLLAELSRTYNIPLQTVKGHRQWKATACPGKHLFDDIEAITARATAFLDNSVPTPPAPTPTNTKVSVRGVVFEAGAPSDRLVGAEVSINGQKVTVDATGEYSLELAPGTYTIEVRQSGYLTHSEQRTFVAGDTAWVSVGLTRNDVGGGGGAVGNASFEGIVYLGTDTSKRVGGAQVYLDTGISTTASASGYFYFDGIAPGEYTVTAVAPGTGSGQIVRGALSGTSTWASVSISASNNVPPPTTTDATGPSCAGLCGSPLAAPGSIPSCYCDQDCGSLGDCCEDYEETCEAVPASSCAGQCGEAEPTASGCQCDAACEFFGDCCSDYASTCQPASASCEGSCGSDATVFGAGGTMCYCDDLCTLNGDCCSNYATTCN